MQEWLADKTVEELIGKIHRNNVEEEEEDANSRDAKVELEPCDLLPSGQDLYASLHLKGYYVNLGVAIRVHASKADRFAAESDELQQLRLPYIYGPM